MYKKIIVPIEIGALDSGERAFRKASTLLDTGGEIVLLNVVEDVPTYVAIDLPAELIQNAIDDAEEKLGMLIRTSGIPASIEIGHGRPAHSILAAAEAHDADLIIVASHIPDFSNYFIGATADRVVRHAKCSVLVDRQR
ncbi:MULTISPECIES: universal stress protein [unclassified Rhizobium]|uniref:universal stress protein n=1 Tax=unclassified Rhizobium TaxID=2613769 RepID=UPI00161E6CFF|nr:MULTISPECIES: universal stress protein [unclassified Rhizobium]MBB3314463.1 nucleotide-binding universal stress UspA family protein [Rhizobium sp. BK181]MBB3539799.1 nucleotide-binding universal stress UspA family protein [Rhizobium sp. BK399]MCS3739192.1 nucleotide-binding universal stress UspA family protein [Rhizobium sp. BK661]MCS4090483.1 nucleotide-binding universal stress UspA family protein [Rhizobium sp. BK176]